MDSDGAQHPMDQVQKVIGSLDGTVWSQKLIYPTIDRLGKMGMMSKAMSERVRPSTGSALGNRETRLWFVAIAKRRGWP